MKIKDIRNRSGSSISYFNYFLFCILALSIYFFDRDFTHLNLKIIGFPIYIVEVFLIIISTLFFTEILLEKDKKFFSAYELKIEHILLIVVMVIALITGLVKYETIYVLRQAAIFYYSIFIFLILGIFINIKRLELFIIISAIVIFALIIFKLSVNPFKFGHYQFYYQAIFLLILANSLLFLKNKLLKAAVIVLCAFFLCMIYVSTARSAWVALFIASIFNAIIIILLRKKLLVKKSFYFFIVFIIILSLAMFILINFLNLGLSNFNILKEQYADQASSTTSVSQTVKPDTTIQAVNSTANPGNHVKSKIAVYLEEFKSIYTLDKINTASEKNSKWRLIVWKDIFLKSMEKPVSGYGFGKLYNNDEIKRLGWDYGADVGFLEPHNSFLSILYRTGFSGLIVFLILIGSFFYKSLKFLKKCQDLKISIYLVSILAVVVFILSISFFMVILEGPQLGIFLWVFIGLGLALMKMSSLKQEGSL